MGSATEFLNADELNDVLDGMLEQVFRLEALYLARKEASVTEHNDENTALVRQYLENSGMACEVLGPMAQIPDIGVTAEDVQTPTLSLPARHIGLFTYLREKVSCAIIIAHNPIFGRSWVARTRPRLRQRSVHADSCSEAGRRFITWLELFAPS